MGSKKTWAGAQNIYDAAETWVDRALRRDDSLFTQGHAIWSSQNLAELRGRFLDRPDVWQGTDFFGRLDPLLRDGPPEVCQLMGEAVYVTYLFVWREAVGRPRKLENINRVLGWSSSPVSVPQCLADGLEPGIARPGGFFTSDYGIHPGYVIEFVEHWKGLEPDEQDTLLGDPWEFKRLVFDIPFRSAVLRNSPNAPVAQKRALLHLVFPEEFEAIASSDVRKRIADCPWFARYITQSDEDRDRTLRQIRSGLESDLGTGFDFFDPHIKGQWDSGPDPWDEFVSRAKAYYETGRLQEEEIDYKLEIGQQLALARDAVLDWSDDWADLLRVGLASRQGHPLTWQSADLFLKWVAGSPDDALQAMRAIWSADDTSVAERIRSFIGMLPESLLRGAGTRARLASVLLMGVGAERYPPYGRDVYVYAYDCTAYNRPDRSWDAAEVYRHALGFLDRFKEEAELRELPVRHRLDAQSLVWAVQRTPPVPPGSSARPDLEALSLRFYFEDSSHLHDIVDLLERKKQVIFQGPPGTGKTYVAKELARHLAGEKGSVRIVQFHPSYSYEDFVQGLRPRISGDGQLAYELRNGPLVEAARRARSTPRWVKHFLIIDEINRGSLARILGELYFLLEYRDEAVRLQYQEDGDRDFSLPNNLYIIGTMNTADRSIALVDMALRRRFLFKEFHPNRPPVEGVLGRWLSANAPEMGWVEGVVNRANELLGEDQENAGAAIGPSHFISNHGLSDEDVTTIWEHGVLPYIRERLFGADNDRVERFKLDNLRPGDSQ